VRLWTLAIVLLIVVLVPLSLLVGVLIKYVPMICNLFLNTEIPSPAPEGHQVVGEDVEFPSKDGTKLRGVFIPGRNSNGRTVIFCHEFGSDMTSAMKFARFLPEAGFNLFCFDFKGHGLSPSLDGYAPKQWVTDKEVADLIGAVEYVRSRPGVDADKIGLFGVSRGGCACVCAISQLDGIKAVVTDGIFSTRITMEHYIHKWVSIFAGLPIVYNNLPNWFFAWLGSLARWMAQWKLGCDFPSVERDIARVSPRPIYVIHGERDTYVGTEQVKKLYDSAREPKRLWIVPKARHNETVSVAREEYGKRVTEFFREHLQ